jgi:glycosyltransferase involved in cell wall biosynthesis
MLNVLFVLYHDFTSNSAVHVFHWANELCANGFHCKVAVPQNPESIRVLGCPAFEALSFEHFPAGLIFPNGRGPDIVHAWTPREIVRRFCERLSDLQQFRLFIHLEDHEWHLLESMLNQPWKKLASLPAADLDRAVPLSLSHPIQGMRFLQSSDGVTVIVDRLRELVPPGIPTVELWPSADRAIFFHRPRNNRIRARHDIAADRTVFVYTGNVHAANAREVRSLYLAVAMLNREGHPATLIRAGRDFYPFLGPDEAWGRANSIELGYVPHIEIPDILAAADILVQPGKPDKFNDYRFPSKLPEFLAIGRPVILPQSNVGLHMMHGVDAFVLPSVDALAIFDATVKITSDPELSDRLARGSMEFFERRLSWAASTRALISFYEENASQCQPSDLAS